MLDGIKWRYELRVRPHLLLHEDLLCALSRKLRNWHLMRAASPMVYISADASNIGDRVSALGIQLLTGRLGVELFCSKAALPATFNALRWLQEHRPNSCVIVGGGGLLQECFVPFWEELVRIRLKFALFGVGANALEGRNLPPRETLDAIAERASMLHVRDDWSHSLFNSAQPGKCSVAVCPSVNYLRSKHMGDGSNRTSLLHVLHPVDIKMAGGDPDRLAASVRGLAGELGLCYDETDHIKEDLSSLAMRYRRAKCVVSSRLHGCIFSYAFGVPFVPVATDLKTHAFVDTHLPGHPVATVGAGAMELREKLVEAASAPRIDYDGAMRRNIEAMNRLLEIFGS